MTMTPDEKRALIAEAREWAEWYGDNDAGPLLFRLAAALEAAPNTKRLADVLSPVALEHWERQESDRARRGDRGCACQLCDSVPLIVAALSRATPSTNGDRIAIPRPVVPFGPEHVSENEATAVYLLGVTHKIDSGYANVGGSNVTATVRKLLADVAIALRELPERGEG